MNKKFTKDYTLMTKGVLIIMMFIHHLFTSKLVEEYSVAITMSNEQLYCKICVWCKICISVFAFLSAYGITYSLMNKPTNYNCYFRVICKRIINIELTVFFIYIIAIFYKRFVIVESIRELYDMGNGFSVIYMLIDMVGLATYFNTPTINITWWYLTYAILLIVAMPFIYITYKKFRYLILPIGCLLPIIVFQNTANWSLLLPSALLGTAFAQEGWFERIQESSNKMPNRFLRVCIEVSGLVFSYHLFRATGISYIYVFAFLIPLLVHEFIGNIPVLNVILKYIGKHATNLFLIHTFVYYYFYTEWIYSFKYDWLILIVMLLICLLISILMEMLKKVFGYNKLVSIIADKISI